MTKSQRSQHIDDIRSLVEDSGFTVNRWGKYQKDNVRIEISAVNIKAWYGKDKVWSKSMTSLTLEQVDTQIKTLVNAGGMDDVNIEKGGTLKKSIETENDIKGFFDKYRCLSNFDETSFEMDGVLFKSGEHAYQFHKAIDSEWQQKILNAETPAIAKKLGRKCPMRDDWEKVKIDVMRNVLWHKFSQNAQLKELLLSTGTKYLEETNYWNDRFWGVCRGVGQNELGKALMAIRSKLMHV